jgi:hypothetical protein
MKIGDARSTVLIMSKSYSKTHDFASEKESHNMIDTILLGAPFKPLIYNIIKTQRYADCGLNSAF